VSLFLDPAEIVRLTGRKRFKAQRDALDRLGIRYTLSARGEPLVREAALDETTTKGRNRGPRWDRMVA
jgi:hypothetical protein